MLPDIYLHTIINNQQQTIIDPQQIPAKHHLTKHVATSEHDVFWIEDVWIEKGKHSKKNRKIPDTTKIEIFKRDNWECAVCQASCATRFRDPQDQSFRIYIDGYPTWKILTVDHIIPKDFGASNGSNNLLTLCNECNGAKANLMPYDWYKTIIAPIEIKEQIYNRIITAATMHILRSER